MLFTHCVLTTYSLHFPRDVASPIPVCGCLTATVHYLYGFLESSRGPTGRRFPGPAAGLSAAGQLFLAPRGYYGTVEVPRFADPWLDRSAVIIEGGLLYRDTFTATPPLTNYLILPPSLVALLSGRVNPTATLAFMVYFSLFNLFAAWLLLYMAPTRRAGFTAALFYLLNPMTFGNTVLRRQDESILVFFFGLALLFLLRSEHGKAVVAIGVALLVKLSAALLLPIATLHSRLNWRYFVAPPVVFLLAWLPFYLLAGDPAVFWDFSQEGPQHPFQLGGISLASLWNRLYIGQGLALSVELLSVLFLVAVVVVGLFILWQRLGILADLNLFLTVVLLFVPKLHAGYFSILAFTLVLMLRRKRHIVLYMLFGTLVIVVDIYKWPVEDFRKALWLMAATMTLLIWLVVDLYIRARRETPWTPLRQWFAAPSRPEGES